MQFATRDWDAMAETMTDDFCRRRSPSGGGCGRRRGRDAAVTDLRAIADLGVTEFDVDSHCYPRDPPCANPCPLLGPRRGSETFLPEVLNVVETSARRPLRDPIRFDVDDLDAAFAELDARFLAGEAAPHARTWSVIAGLNAAFNRHELPPAEWVITVDHRPLVTADASDMPALIRSVQDVTPDLRLDIEVVHRLSGVGAVVTRTAYGTSHDGFDAEWRMIHVADCRRRPSRPLRCFDEADLDAALIKFEELQPEVGRLENAAGQLIKRLQAHFAARNWTAIAEISADDIVTDDRRSVVSSGILHGRGSTSRTCDRPPTSGRPI